MTSTASSTARNEEKPRQTLESYAILESFRYAGFRLASHCGSSLSSGNAIGFAGTEKDFFQNGDLNDGNNYSPTGLPLSSNDVLLTTTAAALNLSGASLSTGITESGQQYGLHHFQ